MINWPAPHKNNQSQGWKVCPDFLHQIREKIGDDEENYDLCPSLEMVEAVLISAAMLQGAEQPQNQQQNIPENIPVNTPCKEAPEHIWLQTAGVWPENGEFSELTWCSDNQHPDDTLYVRADVVPGNSPVIPDGWVACSERMPETYVNVLLTDEHDDVCIGQLEFDGDVYFYVAGYPNRYKATHWMPLPAAPQQEVK
ncbi:TPA: DUF551 domain-containing protein [Enterobacter hormaechei subsp. steigerwaltii]|nr:DUF551 domain-containing protein [Enterobacter hormaechei subsp. steigerwaltii]